MSWNNNNRSKNFERRINQIAEKGVVKMKSVIKKVAVTGLVAVIGFSSMYVNSDYEKSVVTRFGEVKRVDGPGLNFKIPFIESAHKADLRVKSLELPMPSVATFGGEAIGVTLTVNHQINADGDALKALYREFGSEFDYERRLFNKLAIDRAKGVIGTYKLENFMPNREEARLKVKNVITSMSSEWGINVEDVQFADIDLGNNFRKRIEQVAQERAEALKSEQQERQAQFLANKLIEQTRGETESQKMRADAMAYQVKVESVAKAEAIHREGEAKAASMKAQAEVLRNAEGLVELTKAEAMKLWNGSFNPAYVQFGDGSNGNGLIPFMNASELVKNR